MRLVRPLAALALAATAAAPLAAQDREPPLPRVPTAGLAVTAGFSSFDLSGTGTASIFALRAATEFGTRFVVGELGISTMSPREQFDRRVTYVVPEAQLQLQVPFTVVRPYLGVGIGSWISSEAGDSRRTRVAVSGAAGVRVLPRFTAVSFVVEGRLRGVGDGFSGTTADLNAGLAWLF